MSWTLMRVKWLNKYMLAAQSRDEFVTCGFPPNQTAKLHVGDYVLATPMKPTSSCRSTYRGRKTVFHIIPLEAITQEFMWGLLTDPKAQFLRRIGVAYDGELEDVL